jgi:curli biogenesis system outer membrane secretion channel CsgG
MSAAARLALLIALASIGTTALLPAQDQFTKAQQDSAKKADKQAREVLKQAAKARDQARKDAEDAPPASITVAPLPRSKRPSLSVLDFDYQTVVKQGNYDANSLAALAAALHGSDPNALAHEDNKSIGAGLASLVKAELFKGESFRIMERQKLGSALAEQDLAAGPRADPRAPKVARTRKVQAAQFILTGSITKFGSDDKVIGGGGLLKGALGGIGLSKKKTIVEITAQILDASTGEVILSLVGHGVSRKGGGLVIGGGAGGIGGVGGSANTNVKESAIGEAMQLAAEDLAAKVTNDRDELIQAAEEVASDEVAATAAEPAVAESSAVQMTAGKLTVEERLKKLDELSRKRLISKAEYDRKRTEILRDI